MTVTAPPLLHDRYRIKAKLGESRLAVVYRAEDERLKRTVLVHLLRLELLTSFKQRFFDEAQSSAHRSHPGLLDVYDSGEVADRPYMVTEDVQGERLTDRIPLPLAQGLAVMRTIVGAVALSQSQSAPYPPVSSRNVWLLPGSRAVLVENWELEPRQAALDLAQYRAPERVRGGPPSEATTVYALGILTWEALVGRRPFMGPTPEAIAQEQSRGDVLPLSTVVPRLYAPELDRIIAQAVALDAEMRYPTPTDYGRALDLLVDGLTAPTTRLGSEAKRGADTMVLGSVSRVEAAVSPAPVPVAQAPTVVVAPVPPPVVPVRRPQRRVPPPAPPPQRAAPQVVQPQPDPLAMQKQVQTAIRKEMRRQGCRRMVTGFAFRLVALAVLFGAIYFGGVYAYGTLRNYVSGQVQRVDPRQIIARQLPQWLPRWLQDAAPAIPLTSYQVVAPLRLREAPTDQSPILRDLTPGTVVRGLGETRKDAGGREWIRVVATSGVPQPGWVANLPGALNKQ
ncbi:MAG: hypothetical protein NVSMB42_08040 [Herpetosiphon sp.]